MLRSRPLWCLAAASLLAGAGCSPGEIPRASPDAGPSGAADDPDESAGDDPGGLVEIDVQVDGDRDWTRTGALVARGDLVQVTASGSIFINADTEVGPAGYAPNEHDMYNAMPCVDHASLIARVGADATGSMALGLSPYVLAPLDGQLELGPNDTDYGNNTGAFSVHLRTPEQIQIIDDRSVTVPGVGGWVDTGVDLDIDELLAISATGQVDDSITSPDTTWGPDGVDASPGHVSNIVVCANHVSLIGKVGDAGAPFQVGSQLSRVPPAAGRLFLAVNDSGNENNGGKLAAAILVARPR